MWGGVGYRIQSAVLEIDSPSSEDFASMNAVDENEYKHCFSIVPKQCVERGALRFTAKVDMANLLVQHSHR